MSIFRSHAAILRHSYETKTMNRIPAIVFSLFYLLLPTALRAQETPNILVIWGGRNRLSSP